ncbi:MAG TPA: hypothetical protein PKC28_06145 [Bdellovibrionales bacterium]|nr:hypothetical protein [Bdellovibrionales bacterium]
MSRLWICLFALFLNTGHARADALYDWWQLKVTERINEAAGARILSGTADLSLGSGLQVAAMLEVDPAWLLVAEILPSHPREIAQIHPRLQSLARHFMNRYTPADYCYGYLYK